MGIWTGIKRALNSTVGTNYFKPLNEMVTRELLATDDLYKNIPISYDGAYLAQEPRASTYKSKFYTNGSIKLKAVNSVTEEAYAPYSSLYYKLAHADGTFEETTLIGSDATLTPQGQYDVIFEKTFQIRPGDVLYTKFYSNYNTESGTGLVQGTPVSYALYGTETQWSLIDISEA